MNNEVNIADIKGVKDYKLEDNERLWQGRLVDLEEKKTQKGTSYWIFKSDVDENGMQFNFVTFSNTQKVVVEDALIQLRQIKIVYKLPIKFGSFDIVCAELPDGTFSTKEARDSWKKGNKANNRASVIQSAVAFELVDSAGKPKLDSVFSIAEKLLKWVEKETE